MAISYLIKINNTDLPKLKAWKLGRNKLWADANRNMAGELNSTFIGLFPKISLEFTYTTEDEMQTLVNLLDNPFFNVSFWNPGTKTIKTGEYYAGDFDIPIFSVERGLYMPFNVNLVPKSKIT